MSTAGETPALPGSRPLVILGGLHESRRTTVRDFAKKLNAPIYAEPLSGLREDLAHLSITAGERMIGCGNFDSVIRIGNVPTLRFWRDLDESRRDLPLISFSALPFTGCSRGEVFPLESLPSDITPRERDEAFFTADHERAAAIAQLLDDEPYSELAMFRSLSQSIPPNARVYLGNSLPIREWDLAAIREPRGFEIAANRGANGIDGQLSTFFGQCDPGRSNVCVVGDLTAIYDSNAPWIVQQLDAGIDWRIVIINNGGGRIFSRVPSLRKLDASMRERIIENAHDLRFDHWAAMGSLGEGVRELRPDAGAGRRARARAAGAGGKRRRTGSPERGPERAVAAALFQPAQTQGDAQPADRQVEEEDPVQQVVIAQPAAQQRAAGRGEHQRDAEDAQRCAALLGREGAE